MKKDILFEIENNERLFDYRFDAYDIPMWACIRHATMNDVSNKLFHIEDIQRNRDCYVPQREMLKYYIKSALKTPFIHKQRDIVFMFPATGDLLADDKYKSRIYGDYFLAAKEKSITVQSSYNYKYTVPNIDDNIRFFDMTSFLIDKEATDVSEKDLKDIDRLINFLRKELPVSLDEKSFINAKNTLLHTAKRLTPMVRYYRKLYESFSPKAIVIHCGHYLGGQTPLRAAVAKDMGIKVIEIQHGLVSKINPAYNYGTAAFKNEGLLKCLPDYFLLFGDYWGNVINTPVKCITVGNPNFYKKVRKETAVPENTVLVLYNIPDTPDKCLSIYAIELAKQLPDYQITYRFHPLVKRSDKILKRFNDHSHLKNLKIDENPDIYDSLYEHSHIVNEDSTVLFEAACLDRSVYVLKSEISSHSVSPDLFVCFETPAELTKKIKNKEGIILDDKTKESIWGSGFPQTYFDFLKSIGV